MTLNPQTLFAQIAYMQFYVCRCCSVFCSVFVIFSQSHFHCDGRKSKLKHQAAVYCTAGDTSAHVECLLERQPSCVTVRKRKRKRHRHWKFVTSRIVLLAELAIATTRRIRLRSLPKCTLLSFIICVVARQSSHNLLTDSAKSVKLDRPTNGGRDRIPPKGVWGLLQNPSRRWHWQHLRCKNSSKGQGPAAIRVIF